MRGFRTVLEILRSDLVEERDAVRRYNKIAASAEDVATRKLFEEFAAAEQGHVNGLLKLITDIQNGEHVLMFYCPVCGWELSFDREPEPGSEIRCRMCGSIFALGIEDDDFRLISL